MTSPSKKSKATSRDDYLCHECRIHPRLSFFFISRPDGLLRAGGWKKSADGWTCPQCVKESKDRKAENG